MKRLFLMSVLMLAVGLTACAPADSGMDMDHGSMEMMDMDHGSIEMMDMDHGSMEMGDAPFDATFIDGMIEHHQGAIVMAEQALAESERPELRALAEVIIAAQAAEIAQMQAWRADWYPDVADTGGMAMDMGPMEVPADASIPFDLRFIDAMILHHKGAVAMAEAALENTEHDEIRTLADAIIATQTAEIEQMQAWRAEWFSASDY